MKVNAKDLIAGSILVLVALFGLYINGGFFGLGLEQHNLGTARRMGPGYMPMLVFYLLMGLGLTVFLIGLFNGPDPLERWSRLDIGAVLAALLTFLGVEWALTNSGQFTSGYYALGFALLAATLVVSIAPRWRPIGLVHAGMAIFALMLEQFGLIASLVVTIVVASFADTHHRPLGVLGMVLFLCALCWWVFIKELDIRVPVWPVFLTQ